MAKRKRIIIAGGGTGGHIYPAFAVVEDLKNYEVHFIGTKKGLESKILPKTNYCFHTISMTSWRAQKVKTLFLLPWAVLKSLYLILKIRPFFVLGTGGYVSVLPVFLSSFFTKTFLWEINTYPGMANRFLEKFVNKIFVAFPETQKHFKKKVTVVKTPVRKSVEDLSKSISESHKNFHVLVLGGSGGSQSINKVIEKALLNEPELSEGIEWVHQTGEKDLSSEYKNHPQVKVTPYIFDISKEYQWADMVISRSGASVSAELLAARKPTLFVPFALAADDHQRKNAELFVKKDAALMILEKDWSVNSLKSAVLDLKNQPEKRKNLSSQMKVFAEEISYGNLKDHLQEGSV